MQFSHDPALRAEFPQLAAVTLTLDGVTDTATSRPPQHHFSSEHSRDSESGPRANFAR